MTTPVYNVLFLCTGNSASSIMADAISRLDLLFVLLGVAVAIWIVGS